MIGSPHAAQGSTASGDETRVGALLGDIDVLEKRLEATGELSTPAAWRRGLLEHGIVGLDLPVRVGGAAWGAARMMPIFARFGHTSLDLRDVPGGGHARLLSVPRDRRHDNVLAGVCRSGELVAIAVTEPGAGSDLHAITTSAQPLAGGYRIAGRKLFNARLREASRAIVFAQIHRAGGPPRLTAFLVPLDLPGIRIEDVREPLGLRGMSFGGLVLDGIEVPARTRIGGEGQGFSLFIEHFTYWRTAMAAAAIGCARAAIEQSVVWMKEREAFGAAIGRFTHLQQELATHVSRLHMAWLLVNATAERIDARLPAFADAAMAKAEAVEASIGAVDFAMRVHGARGYTAELGIEKRFRDLLGLRIADGTTDVLRGQVARAVLGEPLYELSLGRSGGGNGSGGVRRFW